MSVEIFNPPGLMKPRGYSHAVAARGRLLYVAGQVGVDKEGKPVGDDLESQFERALAGVAESVQEAGGKVENIVKLNVFLTDIDLFKKADIGPGYARQMGRHFPAMTVVEISRLMDDRYLVEIEAVAQLD